jgi:hypothetical protein
VTSTIQLRCRAHNQYEAQKDFGLFVREPVGPCYFGELGPDRVLFLRSRQALFGRRRRRLQRRRSAILRKDAQHASQVVKLRLHVRDTFELRLKIVRDRFKLFSYCFDLPHYVAVHGGTTFAAWPSRTLFTALPALTTFPTQITGAGCVELPPRPGATILLWHLLGTCQMRWHVCARNWRATDTLRC